MDKEASALNRLRAFNDNLLGTDTTLKEEALDLRHGSGLSELAPSTDQLNAAVEQERIILRRSRDSMHVTNATPQMQTFKALAWLGFKDFTLNSAIKDGMRVNVFTGPLSSDDDPIRFGVAAPVAFWKVIAIVQDQTEALSATGYRMDQREHLRPENEFVFSGFTSSHTGEAAQVSIRSIEEEAGFHFAGLADRDPLGQMEATGIEQAIPL